MNLKSAIAQKRVTRFSGFTLMELLVASCVAAVVFACIYAGLAQGFNSVQSAHRRLRATQILAEKLDVIRLYNWSQITNGYVPTTFTEYYDAGNTGVAYNGTIAVTNAAVHSAYNNTMRKLVLQVTWLNSGITNRQRMETLVSQYGIQKYIY